MDTSTESKNHETQPNERGASPSERQEVSGCCGGPAPTGADACCALDAEVKSTGGAGCGCAPKATPTVRATRRCC